MIGNGGDTPNGSGGMIPSVAPPFGMTRWVSIKLVLGKADEHQE